MNHFFLLPSIGADSSPRLKASAYSNLQGYFVAVVEVQRHAILSKACHALVCLAPVWWRLPSQAFADVSELEKRIALACLDTERQSLSFCALMLFHVRRYKATRWLRWRRWTRRLQRRCSQRGASRETVSTGSSTACLGSGALRACLHLCTLICSQSVDVGLVRAVSTACFY